MILPTPDPAPRPAPELQQHHLAALNAAGWALLSFAAAPRLEGLGHRAAAALGLSDGLSGRPCGTNIRDAVELEAYRMGHRAGLVVRTGSAT